MEFFKKYVTGGIKKEKKKILEVSQLSKEQHNSKISIKESSSSSEEEEGEN